MVPASNKVRKTVILKPSPSISTAVVSQIASEVFAATTGEDSSIFDQPMDGFDVEGEAFLAEIMNDPDLEGLEGMLRAPYYAALCCNNSHSNIHHLNTLSTTLSATLTDVFAPSCTACSVDKASAFEAISDLVESMFNELDSDENNVCDTKTYESNSRFTTLIHFLRTIRCLLCRS